MEKDFVYSEISQTDESTSWFFTANSWSRITSSKKSLESQNRLLYKLSTDGSVTIVLATEDGTYNERLVKEIEDKGFKETSMTNVNDDPDHIRTVYSSPDGYSLYDISREDM